MASTAEDYGSELQDLQWGVGAGVAGGGGGTHFLRSGIGGGGGSSSSSGSHLLRSGSGSCYEAEDLDISSSARHHPQQQQQHHHHHHQQHQQHHRQSGGHHHQQQQQQNRGYYSPPGTSYTIVERPASAQHHHSSHATPYRHRRHHGASSTTGSGAISPEQVLRLFGNGLDRRPNDRRTPASSPASVAALRSSSSGGSQQGGSGGSGPTSIAKASPAPQSLSLQELTVRTITMTREPPDSHHGFGICVKGGKDADAQSGVGVYISRVEEGSVAERAGLRPGDSILEVNGTPFRAVTHEEALKMLKSCRTLSMTVRGPAIDPRCRGGHPIWPHNRQQTCSWMDRQGRPVSPPPPLLASGVGVIGRESRLHAGGSSSLHSHRTRKVDLLIEPGQSLGLMIRGGLEYGLGIYVTGVDKESVADRAGLLVGDQILEVNGQSFEEATHDEAVQILKTSKRMSLVIRDVGKVPHSCTTTTAANSQPSIVPISRYHQDHDCLLLESPPGNHHHRPPSPANSITADWRYRGGGATTTGHHQPISAATAAMVEEKARVVLARSERAALSQLLADYRNRRLNVEDLVVSLGDLLNTHEKLTLLTELRELVDGKDRPAFDDLVYRPRLARRKGDRVHNSDLIVTPSLHELPDYDDDMDGERGGRRHSSPGSSRGNRDYLHHHLHADNLEGDRVCETGDVTEITIGNGVGLLPRRAGAGGGGGDARDRDRDRERGDNEDDEDEGRDEGRSEESGGGGGFGGWRTHLLGGLTQRVKSWYWGARPLEIGHKLSRSFDMQEAQLLEEAGVVSGAGTTSGQCGAPRRHHSAQRLARGGGEAASGADGRRDEDAAVVVPDHQGNLRIIVKKSKPTLGIAIEGGANTKHPLPRIINIHDNGAAYDAGGLEVGQLILQVDGHKVEGLHHQEVARLIAESFARRDRAEIEFLVVEAKKSNLEPKPTALIFLEA